MNKYNIYFRSNSNSSNKTTQITSGKTVNSQTTFEGFRNRKKSYRNKLTERWSNDDNNNNSNNMLLDHPALQAVLVVSPE